MQYLVLSDIHANASALEAVLDAACWDRVLFLGDAVNYGPNPDVVMNRLRELPGLFLQGNHDRKISEMNPDTQASTQAELWAKWTRRKLSTDNLTFLRQLDNSIHFEQRNRSFLLHHGNFEVDRFPNFGGRLWPDSRASVFTALAEQYPEDCVLHGHTHVQFEREWMETIFANPGSVGQPRLGQPEACYAILEDGALTYHATEYDVSQTCAGMDELPLDEGYIAGWKEAYQTGTLPESTNIRDFEILQECDCVYR